jgi:lipopolysaccharide biosynthesis regulator YciM
MEEEHNRAAKGQLIVLMQAGHSWQEAATMAGVQISRSAAYRLLQKVRTESAKRDCEMAGMDTQPNCADPCNNSSKTTAKLLQAHPVGSCSRPSRTAAASW